jgi:hypothetical protein
VAALGFDRAFYAGRAVLPLLALLFAPEAARAEPHARSDRGVAGREHARSVDPRLALSVGGLWAAFRNPRLSDASRSQIEGDAGAYLFSFHYEHMLPFEHVAIRALARYLAFQTERRGAEELPARRILEIGLAPALRLPEFGRRAKFQLGFSAPIVLGASNGLPNPRRERIREEGNLALAYGFGAGFELSVRAPRAPVIPFVGFELFQRYATHETTYVDLEDPTREIASSERYSLFTAGLSAGVAF